MANSAPIRRTEKAACAEDLEELACFLKCVTHLKRFAQASDDHRRRRWSSSSASPAFRPSRRHSDSDSDTKGRSCIERQMKGNSNGSGKAN